MLPCGSSPGQEGAGSVACSCNCRAAKKRELHQKGRSKHEIKIRPAEDVEATYQEEAQTPTVLYSPSGGDIRCMIRCKSRNADGEVLVHAGVVSPTVDV